MRNMPLFQVCHFVGTNIYSRGDGVCVGWGGGCWGGELSVLHTFLVQAN